MPETPYRVLLIDDDPQIGAGIKRVLHADFEFVLVGDALAAVERLRDDSAFHVVVCDLRMPGMNGLTLLHHIRRNWPQLILIVLSGETHFEIAVAALNSGYVFRYLTKPCDAATLRTAISDAVAQWQLQQGERLLMEQTWRGSVQALMDVLAIVEPTSFGRSQRLATAAEQLATDVGIDQPWRIGVAARLAQLGAVSLSPTLLNALASGTPITSGEIRELRRIPAVAATLLEHVPRLSAICLILAEAGLDVGFAMLSEEASIVGLVLCLDALPSMQLTFDEFIAIESAEPKRHTAAVIKAIQQRYSCHSEHAGGRTIPLTELEMGMTLSSDVRTPRGLLLAARGQIVTTGLLAKAQQSWIHFAPLQTVEVE